MIAREEVTGPHLTNLQAMEFGGGQLVAIMEALQLALD